MKIGSLHLWETVYGAGKPTNDKVIFAWHSHKSLTWRWAIYWHAKVNKRFYWCGPNGYGQAALWRIFVGWQPTMPRE